MIATDLFEPGWTNYRKTCLYSAVDVTSLLKPKGNTVGVLLGNGMYHVPGGRYAKFTGSFGQPKVLLQLHLEYTDGTVGEFGTDAGWRTSPGALEFSCIYGGEDYDARRELPGWDAAGFDDSRWEYATITQGPGGRLSSAAAPPIQVKQTFVPVSVTRPVDGVLVYDLGQNFAGRPCLEAWGPRGAVLKLLPGELLDEAGLVTQRSCGGPTWFGYTLKGGELEHWRPRFTYTGFRYLQVEGAGDLELLEIRGESTHSSAQVVGAFECSNPLVNQIHTLILASMESNLQSVLTDCPHREKLGWLEVTHLLGDALMKNYDLAQFYTKVQQDIADAQLENGLVTGIAPEMTVFSGGFRDSPEWGSACVINPWNLWLTYADRRVLEASYESMCRYVDYLDTTALGNLLWHGLGDWYDVGPGEPGGSKLTPKGLTASAIYFQDLTILREVALLLGKPRDAEAFQTRALAVKLAFQATFFDRVAGSYGGTSQTANSMPLVLGLADETERPKVLESLLDLLRKGGGQVTAGDVGFSYLVSALTEAEAADSLYQLMCQTAGPGYARQLERGATSLTEAWDANPASSQNHCMLGHADAWLYRGLAGIRIDESAPGYRHFVLRPQFPAGLTWVKATYESIRGTILSHWRQQDGYTTWKLQIPPNTTATVCFPGAEPAGIMEGTRPLGDVESVRDVLAGAAFVQCELSSGEFCFVWPHQAGPRVSL